MTRLGADSLGVVAEPLSTIMTRLGTGPTVDLHRAIAVAWRPTRADDQPPPYLRPEQLDSWRRLVAALRAYGTAVLADPIGTGKTWIAMAAASRLGSRFDVIAPASLATQWRDAALMAGINPPRFLSFERASRGHLLSGGPRATIVDEAHRLRNRDTRRFASLAPWLADRTAIFITATPVVRSPVNLITLLRLGCRDDALALDGVPSLEALADLAEPPAALRQLVIRTATGPPLPSVITPPPLPAVMENRTARHLVHSIARLALDASPGVRTLVRMAMLDAAASSGAALDAVLNRYQALLEHSRDGGGVSRRDIRALAGPLLDQTVLWPVIGGEHSDALPIEDIPLIEELREMVPDDRSLLEALGNLIADDEPTICFTRYLATVKLLKEGLSRPVAWLTGGGSGIGYRPLSRCRVLEAFSRGRVGAVHDSTSPTTLIATELAEEGLNLQRARRVVHVDLPWTATQRQQRLGRIRRIGQTARSVIEISRLVPPPIERSLGREMLLRRQSRSSGTWLGLLERDDPPPWTMHGSDAVVVDSAESGWRVMAVVAVAVDGRSGTVILLDRRNGFERISPADAASLVRGAVAAPESPPGEAAEWLRSATVIATRNVPPAGPATAALLERIGVLARRLARMRDAAGVEHLDRLLQSITAPGPVGHSLRVAAMQDLSDEELMATRLPAPRPAGPAVVTGIRLIVPSRGRYLPG